MFYNGTDVYVDDNDILFDLNDSFVRIFIDKSTQELYHIFSDKIGMNKNFKD